MNEKTVLVGEEEKELRRMKRRRKKNREGNVLAYSF